jgi:hypothetical protein
MRLWRSFLPVMVAVLLAAPMARADECTHCAEWNAPQKPLRIFGNTRYVGVQGLSARNARLASERTR